jgi:hypothetical protein
LFRRQQLRSSCHGRELDLTHRSSFVASPLVCFQCSVVLDRFFSFRRNPTRSFFLLQISVAWLFCSLLCSAYVNLFKSLIFCEEKTGNCRSP